MSTMDTWMERADDARARGAAARRRLAGCEERSGWRTTLVAALGAVAGGVAVYLLDPDRGRSRRAQAAAQSAATLRRAVRGSRRIGRRVSSRAAGASRAMGNAGRLGATPNDAALSAKIASELFGDPSVPKGAININAEQGVVVIRGEVADDTMRSRIEDAVRRIPDVWEVRNLLHLPGEPAPTAR